MADGIMARCWAFALDRANSKLIAQLAHVHSRTLQHVDREDFEQELAMAVAYSYPRFRPEQGTAKAWIRWQARALAAAYRRRNDPAEHALVIAESEDGEPLELLAAIPDLDADRHVEAHAEVAQLLRDASEKQLRAAEMVIRDLTGPEIREEYGCTRQTRNHHLRMIARRAS